MVGKSYRIATIVLQGIPAALGLFTSLLLILPVTQAQQIPAQQAATPSVNEKIAASMAATFATAYVAVAARDGKTMQELRREDFSVQQKGESLEIVEVSRARNNPLLIGTMVDLSGSANSEYRRDYLQSFYQFFAHNIRESERASLAAFAMSTYRSTNMTGNLAELERGLKEIADGQPIGPTALFDCLFTVSETSFQDMSGRRVLLVVSDFQDNASHRKLDETILHMQGMGVAVFPLVPIEQRSGESKAWKSGWKLASRMAEETGGVAYSFESPRELDAALTKIQTLFESSYLLKYRSNGAPQKNTAAKIRIVGKAAEVIAVQLEPPNIP